VKIIISGEKIGIDVLAIIGQPHDLNQGQLDIFPKQVLALGLQGLQSRAKTEQRRALSNFERAFLEKQ